MRQKIAVVAGWLLFLAALGGVSLLAGSEPDSGDGPVRVIFFQTGEDADAVLLYQNGAAVLIDTGTDADAEHILDVMEECQVKRLNYLILTHKAADHVGGAEAVLQKIPVDCVVESGFEEPDERMLALNERIRQKKIPILYPGHTQRLRAGRMRLLVYPPLEKNYNVSSNYSLAVLVQHGKVNMIFAGDALRKRSEELLMIDWPEIDLYKIPHHARGNACSGELFDRLAPDYAVATSGQADEVIVRAAEKNGTRLFYTAEGDCIFYSDGKQLTVE